MLIVCPKQYFLAINGNVYGVCVCARKKFTVPFPMRPIPTDALGGVGAQTSGSRGRGQTSDAKRNQCVVNRTTVIIITVVTRTTVSELSNIFVHVIFTLCSRTPNKSELKTSSFTHQVSSLQTSYFRAPIKPFPFVQAALYVNRFRVFDRGV